MNQFANKVAITTSMQLMYCESTIVKSVDNTIIRTKICSCCNIVEVNKKIKVIPIFTA